MYPAYQEFIFVMRLVSCVTLYIKIFSVIFYKVGVQQILELN